MGQPLRQRPQRPHPGRRLRGLRLPSRRPELLQHARPEEDLRLPAARQPGGDDVRLDVNGSARSVSRLGFGTSERDGSARETGPPVAPSPGLVLSHFNCDTYLGSELIS